MIIGASAAWPDYELIDFGGGRKLERFGARLLDRPSPAAEGMQPRSSAQWGGAIRFERGDQARDNQWHGADLDMNPWTIACGKLTFELRLTPFGHVGLFPEQAENWQWLARVAAASKEPLKILNLFAYTGGSTLVAAAAGAEVTHVDSAANTIEWARKNAELSNLSQAPIRWIAEDALTFVGRELKRGNQYDAIILDPPSYGLGPKKEVWQLEKQLVQLLTLCVELTQRSPRFMLFSCHTPTVNAARRSTAARVARCRLGRGARHADRLNRRRLPWFQATLGGSRSLDSLIPMLISSTQNQRIKDVVKLRDRRARDERNCFVIDGAREIARAIAAGVEILEAFVCDSLCHSDESRVAHRALEKLGATIYEVTPDVFEKLAFGDRADGVLVVARARQTALGDLKLPPAPLVAVLEGVEKPGNLGAVLRSADGAGVSAVIVADAGADFHNPNAIRASLGAVFSVPTCAADSRAVSEWISDHGLTIYATRVDAERLYTDVDWRGPSAVILGSEAHGLSEAWRSPEITGIRLPMLGDADSLNVSATAAVIFYEALRQRNG